jgi:GNAT superfamily N-acetyltransferase
MLNKQDFTIRVMKESDLSFIFNSWLKSFFHSSSFAKDIDKDIYYKYHKLVIERILSRLPTVYVACDSTHLETVFGYILGEGEVLHFLYVKKDFRKLGIGTSLLEVYGVPEYISHLTKDAKKLSDKHKPKMRYNPYVT